MHKIFKKIAIAAGIAGAVGYLVGILTAPKSGKETREDIKNAGARGLSEAEKQLKKASVELSKLVDEAKSRGAELNGRARSELEALVDKAKTAREKAREVLSAIHEGDAEDKDLDQAVKQANDALKHLQAFMKK